MLAGLVAGLIAAAEPAGRAGARGRRRLTSPAEDAGGRRERDTRRHRTRLPPIWLLATLGRGRRLGGLAQPLGPRHHRPLGAVGLHRRPGARVGRVGLGGWTAGAGGRALVARAGRRIRRGRGRWSVASPRPRWSRWRSSSCPGCFRRGGRSARGVSSPRPTTGPSCCSRSRWWRRRSKRAGSAGAGSTTDSQPRSLPASRPQPRPAQPHDDRRHPGGLNQPGARPASRSRPSLRPATSRSPPAAGAELRRPSGSGCRGTASGNARRRVGP